MRRIILSVVTLLVVFGLGMLAGTPRGQSVSSATALASPAPVALAVPVPARCPAIHEALGALESAMRDMREARHDFCGHKREAMEATHQAIQQLRAAEDCDRCR